MTYDDYLRALGYTTRTSDEGSVGRIYDQQGNLVSGAGQGGVDAFNSRYQPQYEQFNSGLYGTQPFEFGSPDSVVNVGGQQMYRVGDISQWQSDPRLQQILQSVGGQAINDPTYGGLIPFAAQQKWSQQYDQPGFWDQLANNSPILIGSALAGGAATGALGNASGAGGLFGGGTGTLGGASLPDSYWSMLADAGGGTTDALGSGAGSFGGGGNMFDWLTDDFWSGLMNTSDTVPGSGEMFGAGSIDPSWWSGAATQAAAPILESGRQASIGDMLRTALGGNSNLGSIASLANGLLGGGGAYLGAQQQANAANNATAAQMAMFNTLNQQSAPWRQAGQQALGTIGSMMPDFTRQFNNQDLNSQLAPNFDFMLNKGVNATKNALNVGNGLVSGNTIQGINDYAQNFAQNAYQQAFNNWNSQQSNIFNRLSNIAGLGQTANQTSAQAGTSLGAGAANSMQNAGTAAGGGIVGATNAVTGGLNNALGWYMLPQFMGYGGQYG